MIDTYFRNGFLGGVAVFDTSMRSESPPTPIDEIASPERFEEHDVPVHVDVDTVNQETVDTVSGMDDLAPTGVVRSDGSVLLMRVTTDCKWKIPCRAVGPNQAYGIAAKEWVSDSTGLEIELDSVEGIWRIELTAEETDDTAVRNFVVFSASPKADSLQPNPLVDDVSPTKPPADMGWYDELPEGAEEPPGTELFFE